MNDFLLLEIIFLCVRNIYVTAIIFASLLTFIIIVGLTAPEEKKTFPPLPPTTKESVGTQTQEKADINYIIN